LVGVVEVKYVSGFTRNYSAVSTRFIGYPRYWTGVRFWMQLAVPARKIAVLFAELMTVLQSL
jgi:hypothetical protein